MYEQLAIRDLLSLSVHDECAAQILEKFPTLRELAEASPEELSGVRGLGPSKAKKLLASIELGKRLNNTPLPEPEIINSPQNVNDLLKDMAYLDREIFKVILLNTRNMVIDVHTVSLGTLNSSLVHPREVFKMAVKRSSNAVIICHNHPSSDPTPSREDIDITKRIQEAGRIMGIELLDHIIICPQRYVSFREQGLL